MALTKVDGEGASLNPLSRIMVLFGRVPLFFYILHLYLIHFLAIAAGWVSGRPFEGLFLDGSKTAQSGFDLWIVCLMWVLVVAILYSACRWYEEYKRTHGYAWLKYL